MNQKSIFPILIFLFILHSLVAQINPKDVTIIRDQYGVPHIYGKTDADMVYGLAWAACEDDFKSIQENYLATQGRLGEALGKDGAIMDVMAHIVQAKDRAELLYNEHTFPENMDKMFDAYVQATNAYAVKYPDKILLKNSFPITKKDVLAAHILGTAIISNVQYPIIQAFGNTLDEHEVPTSAGSNGFAANKNKTADGSTYLAINSHQPLTGPYSWYEAHINSEESGINIHGGTFPGGMFMFIGANKNLGWCHTINFPDHVDVYKLKMNPKKKLQYELDGKWENLEEYPIKFKVKLGFIKLPIKKKFYLSKHGIVIKNKEGYYAIRFRANMDLRSSMQWYEMNKANNLEEFKKAIDMQLIPGTNVVYADKEGNLFYISLGKFPYRDKAYDWQKILPGNKSELIWGDEMHPLSEHPQVTNPEAGYIYNTNNSPFKCSSESSSLDPNDYDITFGFQTKENNRGLVIRHLFEQKEKITYQDFKDIKYDVSYMDPIYSHSMLNLEQIFDLDPNKHPKIEESIQLLKDWDRQTKPDRKVAVMSVAVFNMTTELFKKGLLPGTNTLSEDFIVEHLLKAQKHLKKHFKRVDVTLGEIQYIERGKIQYPVGGMPDVMAAMNFEKGKKGKLKGFMGDAFFQFIKWDKDGNIEIEAINAFGSSSDPESKHFKDQLPMYLKQELRPMYLDKEKIKANEHREYHPGEF